VRDSGNDVQTPEPFLKEPLTEPDPNHGKARIRTSESLNEAYMMWVPSADPHSASGDDKMSSVKECILKTAPFVVKCDMNDYVFM
jgi:hypothetical protein